MRRFFKVIFQLIAAALVIVLFTVTWIVFDGLNDLGEKADVALVTGPAGSAQAASDPRLDLAIKLYNETEFPLIVVSGPTGSGAGNGPGAMAKYLESQGIPSSAIIEAQLGESTPDTARDMAEIMKAHHFQSVLVITDYYHVTFTKLALYHEGIAEIEKAHVGKLQKDDARKIGTEVVALYEYIGKIYLLPAAKKIKEEAQVGLDKAKVYVEGARKKVNNGLDSMSK